MRRLLFALSFALLPLAAAHAEHADHQHEHAHEHEHAQHDEHASLAAHEHGAAQLNVALEGQRLELALESPAMNLLGFEHAAVSSSDKAAVAHAQHHLQTPLTLFGIAPAAGCAITSHELHSPLFEAQTEAHAEHAEHAQAHDGEHSDIDANYVLTCKHPEALAAIDLSELFKRFPATDKIQVQLIGPNGQQGAELSAAQPRLRF